MPSIADSLNWHRALSLRHLLGPTEFGLTEGKDLFIVRAYLPREISPEKLTISELRGLISAVWMLHGFGRPHGGIKPSNLFLTDSGVQLVDPNTSLRTPRFENARFAAPEILSGNNPTFDSDYYAVGALQIGRAHV